MAQRFLNDPEGSRLPVKLDTTTNGEFAPVPLEHPGERLHERMRRLHAAGLLIPHQKEAADAFPRQQLTQLSRRQSQQFHAGPP